MKSPLRLSNQMYAMCVCEREKERRTTVPLRVPGNTALPWQCRCAVDLLRMNLLIIIIRSFTTESDLSSRERARLCNEFHSLLALRTTEGDNITNASSAKHCVISATASFVTPTVYEYIDFLSTHV
ncbi:GfV=B36-ORF2 [Ichnoviriform fumiferanae]|uniref:GfV=B36-ORF2 n=1 Tax=Ichnoviriform fumiferanae TaxID=419435 RepID=A2PZT4_9VIRU|nr:GfV=B36-ORF2 [Ichnoviriform fumiferanae]BAF45506.1 GfV=B36-ORF2 [Ichnoviriform fumiferanae]